MKKRTLEDPFNFCSIWGWNDASEVALDIYSGPHDNLLGGDLLFAWKGESKELRQLVIVRNFRGNYGIGLITTGYTALLPDNPIEYLQTILLDDLNDKFKLRKEIIESYKQIIKNEITSD